MTNELLCFKRPVYSVRCACCISEYRCFVSPYTFLVLFFYSLHTQLQSLLIEKNTSTTLNKAPYIHDTMLPPSLQQPAFYSVLKCGHMRLAPTFVARNQTTEFSRSQFTLEHTYISQGQYQVFSLI